MPTKIEELRVEAETAKDLYVEAMASFDDNNLPTVDDAARIDGLRAAMVQAETELARQVSFAAERSKYADHQREIAKRRGQAGIKNVLEPAANEAGSARMNLGVEFFQNPSYQEWLASVTNAEGVIPESRKNFNSPSINFKGFADLDRYQSLLVTGVDDASAGVFVQTQRMPGIIELGSAPQVIRDLITVSTTESDAVEYVRELARYNNAAPVAEATATSGASGLKPESGLTYEKITGQIKTIAHWIPATKRALSDAAQMRLLIERFLREGLDEQLEYQIVNGDGTGENFTGILNTSGVQAQAYATDIFTTTRQARRKVRTVGRRIPTAFVFNPIDAESFALAKDSSGRYYFGGPAAFGAATTLWGLPVVESEEVPQGTGLVGNWPMCVLWDRESATIQATDSHSDFFIRNLVAILAELRAGFGILKPNAMVEIDLTP